ncbi:MAG: S8 family serine peptidase [bacterium]
MRITALVLACTLLFYPLVTAAQSHAKLSRTVETALAGPSREPVKVWVYFADHGERNKAQLADMIARVQLSDRARERRFARSNGPLTDVHDVPAYQPYLESLRQAGCRIHHSSKYLNAVSVFATPDQIRALASMRFVRKIDRVRTARLPLPPAIEETPSPRFGTGLLQAPALAYGDSYDQLNLIDVIPLHAADVNGRGVIVAMLDTGFNRSHEALIHLDVVAEWDFINNDPVTKNEPGDFSSQQNHGTATLSALAGYKEGQLIGPAYAASFALAKTERVDTEIQQEEDDYVRALEWADSLGAVIVSSSLGYFDWYTYEDMDGNTAVTTIAADIAASRGIAVITAAGNEGPLPWPGIIAPSDGDSVIAVGAVNPDGTIASFSSRGPSYDGRIKPDVCAQGVMVRAASALDSTGYYWSSGTSLATPLVAGAAAQCLQMHPYWSPIDLRDSLRAHADHAASPNNDFGWGIIDAYQTALGGATSVAGRGRAPAAATLLQSAPNPFVPSVSGRTSIRYTIGAPSSGSSSGSTLSDVKIAVYDVMGRLVKVLFEGPRLSGGYVVDWDGVNHRGVAVSSGVYYYTLSVGSVSVSKKLVLIRR